MKVIETQSHIPGREKLCPFIVAPLDDCYCIKLSSQDVEKAVFYCSKHFELCETYKKNKC